MPRETTLVLVKPDGMRRGLAGEIIARFERRGGDFALELSENIVHGSDSRASAKRELALFFPDGLA